MPFRISLLLASGYDVPPPNAWYTPDSIQQSGGVVSSWRNIMADTFHLTAFGNPVYDATAIGGLPGVNFDGSDDHFGGYYDGTAPRQDQIMAAAAYTHFSVFRATTVDTDSTAFSANDGVIGSENGRISTTLRSSGISYFSHYDSGGLKSASVAGFATGTNYIAMGRYDGTTISGRLNAANATSIAADHAIYIDDKMSLGISNGYRLVGKISEALFYRRALTADEQANVFGYLSEKYGIAV